MDDFARAQALVLELARAADEATLRSQYHPDLSPLGWHLGHCVFVECLWLHQQVRGDDSVTTPIADLYIPPRTPKAERGRRLPARAALLAWAAEMQAFNRTLARRLRADKPRHPLMDDDYLIHFLSQHNCQHHETMVMILNCKALGGPAGEAQTPHPPLRARAPERDHTARLPAGHYRVGGRAPVAFDNELPAHETELASFRIGRRPLDNAAYLAFMEDGGYRDRSLWSEEGWHWRRRAAVEHPYHWRRDPAGHWYGIDMHGDHALVAEEPVSGISHFEASACARWAGARLPHEYEWEAACRSGLLERTGQVWEWCATAFHPYPGYRSFPYPEYSQPWFDGRHYSLRGGSLHTAPAIKRPSFRNFYEADKRHIFAGLRLVYA